MLRSFGSGGCPAEPQSPLCTCGVSLVSPASSPHVSSSSAPESSPTRGGPARFSLSGERCRGLAAFCQSGGKLCPSCVVLCGPPLVLVVHFHPLSSCACWGRHHHRRRLDLIFYLWARLRHRYLCWDRCHHVCCLWFSCPLWFRLPAPDPRCQRSLRPRRFWASGLAVSASSGSWRRILSSGRYSNLVSQRLSAELASSHG